MSFDCQNISAVVLTYNEESNVKDCLESVHGFCDIHVVDSGSTDRTREICNEYTRNFVVHAYENHSSQWQWSLENLEIGTDWILALDADFVVTPELKARILAELRDVPDSVSGIYVRHLYRFGGDLIRFGGTKQSWLRIIRKGEASPDLSDMVDFRFVVDGETSAWKEAVIEYNRHDDDISTWMSKQDKFSVRLALEEELRRAGQQKWQITPRFFGNNDERFAWLRDAWLNFPLFLRPVIYFLYRFVFALGFLDGKAGFLYAALQGFWLRLIVDWKTVQIRKLALDTEELRAFSEFTLTQRQGSVKVLFDHWKAGRDS